MMKKNALLLSMIVVLSACGGSGNQGKAPEVVSPPVVIVMPGQPDDGLAPLSATTPDPKEHLAGGEVTTQVINQDAFSQSAPAIRSDFELDGVFKSGDHLFRGVHVGQGPLFNNPTCQGCHIKDGRGEVPSSPDEAMTSMFLRISDGQGNPDLIYGDQIQTFGMKEGQSQGLLPKHGGAIDEGIAYGEAYAWVEYQTIAGQFDDGQTYQLRKPIYKVKDLAYGDFNPDVRLSPRVTPSIFGSGLLHAIPEANITSYADPDDIDGDGISGRAVFVTEPISGQQKLARFGYKALTTSVLEQISGAYRGDMGITNIVAPQESCTSEQTACIAQAQLEQDKEQDGLDLSVLALAQVEFYNRLLAVPVRRGFDSANQTWQADVVAGRALFFAAQCASCHIPRHKTGEAEASLLGDAGLLEVAPSHTPIAALSNQVIYPYTDLLLHDMGGSCATIERETAQGEACTQGAQCYWVQRCEGLADDRPEGSASGTEWRTPPLWGLGLVNTVNARATYLHDGRARNISEAILWHGGEAEKAKAQFKAMSANERQQLLTFLTSL